MVRQLRYPTGVRPLLIEATARRKRVEQSFTTMLESRGYAEVMLPMIDYVDAYAAVAESLNPRQAYRFTDRDGELVTLRSDFTPMLARALAPAIDPAVLPLRVFYRGDVIRCDRTRLGANREMFQIGAEIIGDGSLEADREIVTLVSLLVPDAMIILLAPRKTERIDALLSSLDGHRISFEVDDQPSGYYSGFHFAVYGGRTRTRIAQGGRYDDLYERFGAGAPAIGFTFTIDDLD